MAALDERTSTQDLLASARFHGAALEADPRTKHLGAPVRDVRARLKEKRNASEDKQEERVGAYAVLLRTDFEADDLLRAVEIEVLGAARKDRESSAYRAVFPRGLSALLSLRGEDQANGMRSLIAPLKQHFPAIAEKHEAEITRLANASVEAESAWKKAETEAAQAFAEEVIARAELVRQLQKSRGALGVVFPGMPRRVRSFFRPARRAGSEEGGEEGAGGEGGGGAAAA